MKTIEELEAALTIAEERILELQGCQVQPVQEQPGFFSRAAMEAHSDGHRLQPAQPKREPVTIPDEVRKAAKAMQKDHYRGPLAWAVKVIDFVADYTTPPAQPEQEPVAWSVTAGKDYRNCIEITHCKSDALAQYEESTKGGFESIYTLHHLYAAPPQRQPLIETRISDLMPINSNMSRTDELRWMARAVEREHDIKEQT